MAEIDATRMNLTELDHEALRVLATEGPLNADQLAALTEGSGEAGRVAADMARGGIRLARLAELGLARPDYDEGAQLLHGEWKVTAVGRAMAGLEHADAAARIAASIASLTS